MYKLKERLKAKESYRTKPEIAAGMIRALQAMRFKIERVLADSLYEESGVAFVNVLYELKLPFVLAIRSNHGVWLPQGQRVRTNRWRKFNRVFSNGKSEQRWIREITYGKRGTTQFWQVTTDPKTLPDNRTWSVMSHIEKVKYHEIGNLYGLRNWVETLFGCLETRGFCPESTHLQDPERLSRMLALLTIALCWTFRMGEWLATQKPIAIKKHGRKARSIFRYGFDYLRRTLLNLEHWIDEFFHVLKILSCT